MAGVGRFKLTDALPSLPDTPLTDETGAAPGTAAQGKGKGKAKNKGKKGQRSSPGAAAEQLREGRESSQAKNAEGSNRDRMVDIGRGNQQAGRQRSGGGK
jgi:hypothetical protein